MLSWKDKNATVKCVVNAVKDEAYEYLMNEVHHVKDLIIRSFGIVKPEMSQVLENFFGVRSSIFDFLKR